MNGCLSSVTNFSTRHGYASQSITQTPLKNLIHTERIKAYILASFAASSASFAAFAAFTMRGPTWRTFMRSWRLARLVRCRMYEPSAAGRARGADENHREEENATPRCGHTGDASTEHGIGDRQRCARNCGSA